jgi:hypothetical protein
LLKLARPYASARAKETNGRAYGDGKVLLVSGSLVKDFLGLDDGWEDVWLSILVSLDDE